MKGYQYYLTKYCIFTSDGGIPLQSRLIEAIVRAVAALLALWLLVNLIPTEVGREIQGSLVNGRGVGELVAPALKVTLLTLGKGFLVALPLALLFGIPAGRDSGGRLDRLLQAPMAILMGIPVSLLCLWSVFNLAVRSGVSIPLPTASFIALVLAMLPWLARAVRDGVRGGALLSPIGSVLQQTGTLLALVMIFEQTAPSPGIFRLLVQGLRIGDAPVVAGALTWLAVPLVLIHLAGDLLLAPQLEARPARRPSLAWLAGGGALLLILLITAVLSFGETQQLELGLRNRPPGGDFPLGTDDLGRNVFARLSAGARTSLIIASFSTALAAMGGAIIGAVGGLTGRIGAAILSPRVPMPALLGPVIAYAGLAMASRPSVLLLIAVLGITAIPASAHAMRRLVQEPEKLGPLCSWLGTLVLIAAQGLMVEGLLGFLGLSVLPPVPSLGNLLGDAMPHLRSAPHMLTVGWVAAAGMAGLFLIGLTLRDEEPALPQQHGGQDGAEE